MKGVISVNVLCSAKYVMEENHTVYEALERIAEMGAKGIDLMEEYSFVHPHANLYKLKELKKKVNSLGMCINSCWYYTNPLQAIHISSRQAVIDQLKEYIAITSFMDARYMALPPGEPTEGMSRKEAQDALMSVYEELMPACEEYNVIIGMEVGRMHSPISSPAGALAIVKRMNTKHLTVTPDWEAWRYDSDVIPNYYAEYPEIHRDPPESVEMFKECLPYSPFVHAKLFEYDEETGLDPNLPLKEMLDAMNESPIEHDVCIEYEGWVPQCWPDRDSFKITGQFLNMLETNLK